MTSAAFDAEPARGRASGMLQVRWSEGHNPKFTPADEYMHPLIPWEPRFNA